MNVPRDALLTAFVEDVRPMVANLRARGWPVEVVVVLGEDWYGVRLQVELGAMPVPVEAST